MSRTVFLVLVTLFRLSTVYSQAPGDENRLRCVESSTYGHTYPDNVNVLMDSWNYEQLLPGHGDQPIPGAVWTDASCDDNDDAQFPFITPPYWQHGAGGICRWQAQVCGYTVGEQNNWLFTQHISKAVPDPDNDPYTVRVFVNVTYSFQSCRTRNRCNPQFRLLKYMTNDEQTMDNCSDTSLYSGSGIMPSDTVGTEGTDGVVSDQHYFNMNSSQDGLYLALHDSSSGNLRGTCVGISRLIVYRHECPAQAVGLVRYPATQAPVSGTVSVQTQCVDNAIPINSAATCDSNGIWVSENAECLCEEGYEEQTHSGEQVCQACEANAFRSEEEDSCTPCPSNTIPSSSAAAICQCIEYNYRVDVSNPYCGDENHPGCRATEGANTPCTAAPGKPTNLHNTSANGTAITVTWSQPTDFGGRERDDIFYRVLRQEVGSLDSPVELASNIRNTPPLQYTVTDLKAVTQYTIQVVAENGVSYHDNEEHRVTFRTAEVVVETGEGPPEAVPKPRVVDKIVIVWRPPAVPNGVITGYVLSLSFCPTGPQEGSAMDNSTLLTPDIMNNCENMTFSVDSDTLYFVLRETFVPNYPNNLTVTIAGVTGETMVGEFSDPITFVPFAAPDIVVVTDCPVPTSTPTCPTATTSGPKDDSSASVEDCIVNMVITAGAIFVLTTLIMCFFTCIIACLCHNHKMKTYKINLKKEMHSKWEY